MSKIYQIQKLIENHWFTMENFDQVLEAKAAWTRVRLNGKYRLLKLEDKDETVLHEKTI